MKPSQLRSVIALVASLFATSLAANPLFSLENLERERAALISTLTDAELSTDERQRKSQQIVRRMADIERMVLRDDRIAQSDKVIVKRAFANYDLTFLVHASTEQQLTPLSHWLNSLQINEQSINRASAGVR